MSTSQDYALIDLGDGGDPDPITLNELEGAISPKLTQGDLEIEPLAVTRLGGTLPWESETVQIDGGETLTGSDGDQVIQFVFKAVITKSQFETLAEMRARDTRLRLISSAYTGPVSFDELKFDRIPDANGFVRQDGSNSEQPLYEIQLQSKEDEDDSLFG